MANTYDAALFVCPYTQWTVQPIATRRPIVTRRGTFVQFWCPACDSSHRPRWDADYRASEPGVHAVAVTPSTPPPVYQCRYEGVQA